MELLELSMNNVMPMQVYQGISPFKNVQDLNVEQQKCVEAILSRLMVKAGIIESDDANLESWKFTIDKKSELCTYLSQIVTIVSTILPAKKCILKYGDYELKQDIDRAIEKIERTTRTFEKWKKELDDCLLVFETTLPQHGPYKDKLNEMGENYATIVMKDVAKIDQEKTHISDRIKARLKNNGKRQTSDISLQLMVSAHDIDPDYLKNKIEKYRNLIIKFKEKEKQHDEAIAAMKKAQACIDRPFNLLWYLIKNNCGYSTYNEGCFNVKYKMGAYKELETCLPKVEIKELLHPVEISAIKLCHLTQVQEIYVIQLFEYLSKKYQNVMELEKERDPFNFKCCMDPDFAPLLSLAYFWTPCENHDKIKKDADLNNKVLYLISLIDKAIKLFNDFTVELDEKLGEFKFSISQNNLSYKDNRNEYIEAYEQTTKENLTTITEHKQAVLAEIKIRLAEDARADIHLTSKDLICHSLDIDADRLNMNITSFHDRSKMIKECVVSISQKIDLMNEAITKFQRSFNILNYFLTEVSYEGLNEGLTDWVSFWNKHENWFNIWYFWKYYNYMNAETLKKPSIAFQEYLEQITIDNV